MSLQLLSMNDLHIIVSYLLVCDRDSWNNLNTSALYHDENIFWYIRCEARLMFTFRVIVYGNVRIGNVGIIHMDLMTIFRGDFMMALGPYVLRPEEEVQSVNTEWWLWWY